MTFTRRVIVCLLSICSVVAVNCEAKSSTAQTTSTPSGKRGGYQCKAEEEVRVEMGYSDSWVVEVKGGRDEADKIAEENGFVNLGQVSKPEYCLWSSCWPVTLAIRIATIAVLNIPFFTTLRWED